jgi:alpha,alpha-trehalose phosphorylase
VLPDAARDLLAFRFRTLPGAMKNAEVFFGRRGAVFPWMGDSERGTDNSIDGRVRYLQHQNGDIAYAVDQYARVTGDRAFMREHGWPILMETARFWAGFCFEEDGAWHSEGSVGPDESTAPGRDNGFTHLMARHNLEAAVRWGTALDLPDPPSSAELAVWRDIAQRLAVPEVPGLGIPLQDQYLLDKPEADVAGWRLREDHQHWRLPEAGKVTDYRLIKQADIVLAMFLLQHRFDGEALARAYDFYEPMTQHISSLSYNTHAIVAARIGRDEQAYDYFRRSAALDLDDLKGATADGLHAAALGGCWQAVVFGFAGLQPLAEEPVFDPRLPASWKSVTFRLRLQGKRYRVRLARDGEQDIEPLP